MSTPTGVRTKYHVALGGKGYMLRGTPGSPQYIKEQAPALVNQLGSGDLNYNALNGSGWSYWSQVDWSGGFQSLKFKDDASFKDGQAVDVLSKFGEVKLQNDFVSGGVISGSHSFGAHGVHGSELLVGTIKSGAAELHKINASDVVSQLSAMVGISAVNTITRFNNDSIIGMARTSGSVKTLSKYNGSVLSGFRNANPIVRSAKGIGIRLYTGEKVASLSGDVLYYSTDLSTFTSAYQAGKDREIPIVGELHGVPYFFVKEGNKVEMQRWDEFAERNYTMHTWENLTNFGIKNYVSHIMITGKSNGKSVAYAFNGARLWQIFDDQLRDSNDDFSKPFEYEGNLQTKGATFDGKFWFPGLYGKTSTVEITPFENFNNKAYCYAITGSNIQLSYTDSTKYAISGHVVSSEFGHKIGGVDKLVNTAVVNCKALAANEVIEIFRSTDGGDSFTSVGTLKNSVDGAIDHKALNFPSGFVTKLWNYKAQLVGDGTSTPTLLDITHEYRPIPDLKKRWQLSLDAGDDIRLFNRQNEERSGRAIIQDLWLNKEEKRTVVYEDTNAFSVALLSAMTSAATSALVKDTRLMPPKGRVRVLKAGVVEEMTYTSATGQQILGITRAQKGTKAGSYTSANRVDNFYNVVITNVQERLNYTDQKTTESIAVVSLLEV